VAGGVIDKLSRTFAPPFEPLDLEN